MKALSQIVDTVMYCVIRMAEELMSDEEGRPAKHLKAKPLPELEQREAASWFNGWWCGTGVGAVIGVGLTVILFTSGVLE